MNTCAADVPMRIYLDPTQRADLVSRAQTNGPSGTDAAIAAATTEGSISCRRPPITQNQSMRRSVVDVIRAEKK